MAYIKEFTIKNFKGIEDVSISLSGRYKCPVVTLVGLNESGKTTILEALSNFVTRVGTISQGDEENDAEILSCVPISKKANFTGDISISALVTIEDQDKEKFIQVFSKNRMDLDLEQIKSEFFIEKKYSFVDGSYQESSNIWQLQFYCKSKQAKYYKPYQRPSDLDKDLWYECVTHIRKSLPSVAYFPTFLVDVPDRIYLEPYDGEQPSQRYYREVLQDVLDSLQDNLSIETHVVKRIKDFKEKDAQVNWYTKLLSRPEKRQIDSVIQKISSSISKEVIGSWSKVFNRPTSAKHIHLEWGVDIEKNGIPYINISISDGESHYALNERSLGFRWFFLFLLFSRFKKEKTQPSLFLFDEPAANLHARAQMQLLESFERIIEDNNSIIYSTHSSHMINPKWVPSAYIIENKAISYDDSGEEIEFANPPTSIDAFLYRNFVSQNPERTTYFQPILDRLDEVRPQIIESDSTIVTEGISDFHAISYYCKDILKKNNIRLIPGLGDTGHDLLISRMIAEGRRFMIILDDDKSGKKGAERYKESWYLSDQDITTYGALDKACENKKFEQILSEETLSLIAKHYGKGKSNKPSKKEIGMYYSEANAGIISDKSTDTELIFRSIIEKSIEILKK